jgi:hypothetical protein
MTSTNNHDALGFEFEHVGKINIQAAQIAALWRC